ncbi:hypothetical protein [uncultured Microscilla sp.]|uniref:hypothetical protein n=1 Tax=uncultured Microscilla sp. TaxID=432653 RepID=UPI002625F994|nr:hypothetical protein [uncultured Microscilla sp.]
MKKLFDIARFGWLLKAELYRSKRGIIMAFAITFGLLLLNLWLEPLVSTSPVYDAHPENYALALFMGGFALSSLAFSDLGNHLKQYHYLALPASTLEKLLTMWLLTTLGWVLSFSLMYYVYTLIANPLGQLLFPQVTFEAYQPLGSFSLRSIHYYLVLQGAFLVGAAHFRGYVFVKTLLVLVLFGSLCVGLGYLMISGLSNAENECLTNLENKPGTLFYGFWQSVQWVFWWLFAPLCWVVTFFGLKEKEV